MTKKPFTLFINTSGFNQASLALESRGKTWKTSFNAHNNRSEQIFGQLAFLLKKAGAELTDIGRICIAQGPGSFSGIRTGVAVGNTLSLIFNLPLYGFQPDADLKKSPPARLITKFTPHTLKL